MTLKLPGGNSGTRGGAGLQRASIVARERINIVRLARLSKNSSVRDHRNSVVTVTVALGIYQSDTSQLFILGPASSGGFPDSSGDHAPLSLAAGIPVLGDHAGCLVWFGHLRFVRQQRLTESN